MTQPTRNADGLDAIPLTEEQKYLFDTRGWLLLPGVLSDAETAEMREFCYRLQKDALSIPSHQRATVGGPLERLIDHPRIVGFMNEFVADEWLGTESGYGFRLESSFLALRRAGDTNFGPHGGSGAYSYPHNSHVYYSRLGSVYSGLTRAVWELNPVQKGGGGTKFLTGSHKAAYPAPPSTESENSPLWEDYDCPAGSLLFFTEAVTHTGARWTNPDSDRVALFQCYNTVGSRWHNWEPKPEVLEGIAPLRRTLFRPVYCQDNRIESPIA